MKVVRTYVVFLSHFLDECDDLEGGCRVQTGGGLIEEEDLGAGNELVGNADTALLTTRDTLPDGCTNQCVSLTVETEGVDECFNSGDTLVGADALGQRETSSKQQSLSDG